MNRSYDVSHAPRQLRIGSHPAGIFDRREGLYAVRVTDRSATGEAVAHVDEGAQTRYAIFEGQPAARRAADELAPVYSAGAEGPLAVATGRLFVRFANGVPAADQRTALEALGFQIERTLSYAPNAAWVEPRTGGPTFALEQLDAVRALDHVEHVEPQLLMQRAAKDD